MYLVVNQSRATGGKSAGPCLLGVKRVVESTFGEASFRYPTPIDQREVHIEKISHQPAILCGCFCNRIRRRDGTHFYSVVPMNENTNVPHYMVHGENIGTPRSWNRGKVLVNSDQ